MAEDSLPPLPERYADRALGLHRDSRVRRMAYVISHSVWFERAASALIFLNSIALALTDFSCFDRAGAPVVRREVVSGSGEQPCSSWRNDVVITTDPFFIGCFTLECVIKVLAHGFWDRDRSKATYIRDAWNRLDFVVVLSGLAEYCMPGGSSESWVSALRTARVLRPLQALHEFPRLRNLVTSMMLALPALGNVTLLMLFVFVTWGILSLQLWGSGGLLHGRCRLTPVPVLLPEGLRGSDAYVPFRHDAALAVLHNAGSLSDCLPGVSNDDADAWFRAGPQQNCSWPIDHDDVGLCALADAPGGRTCSRTWCGSNFVTQSAAVGVASIWKPALAFSRFGSDTAATQADWQSPELGWGMASFDDFPHVVLTIYQCLTLESWAFISYTVQDAYSSVIGGLYFFLLVLIGSWFLVNFTVAVLYQEFLEAELRSVEQMVNDEERRMQEEAEHSARARQTLNVKAVKHTHKHDDGEALAVMSGLNQMFKSRRDSAGMVMTSIRGSVRRSSGVIQHVVKARVGRLVKWWVQWKQTSRFCNGKFEGVGVIARHRFVEVGVISMILLNTVTLAMDRAGQSCAEMHALEWANVVFTVFFAIEATIKISGFSLRVYLSDSFNAFDAFIVTISLVELILQPPTLELQCDAAQDGGGGFTALRTFRLLRVMRLMKAFKSLHRILDVIMSMMKQMAPFASLVLLFLFIFSLLGMQLFALRFRFDACAMHSVAAENDVAFLGTALGASECAHEMSAWRRQCGNHPADGTANMSSASLLVGATARCYNVPRAHFDNLWSAFGTVFQVLTGEDWNAVMYDAHRSTGVIGVLYFVLCTLIGFFLLLNLFLAMLLGCFEAMRAATEQKQLQAQADARKDELSALPESSGTGGYRRRSVRRLSEILARHEEHKKVRERNLQMGADAFLGSLGSSQKKLLRAIPKAGKSKVVPTDVDDGDIAPLALTKAKSLDSAGQSNPKKSYWTEIKKSRQIHKEQGDSAPGAEMWARINRSFKLNRESPAARDLAADLTHDGQLDEDVMKKHVVKPTVERIHFDDTKSLWFLRVDHPARAFCLALVRHPYFERTVLALILISSVMLALENPLQDPESSLARVIKMVDPIITAAFTAELLFKIVAFGFVLHHGAYLRTSWNQLDFLIVAVSLVSVGLETAGGSGNSDVISALRVIRALRALRPLRVIERNPGMKKCVGTLIDSMPAVANVTAIALLFLLIFAIVGVSYFKGLFWRCRGEAFDMLPANVVDVVVTPPSLMPSGNVSLSSGGAWQWPASGSPWDARNGTAVTSKQVCLWLGCNWERSAPQNFDHVFSGMLTLFEMATTEGWTVSFCVPTCVRAVTSLCAFALIDVCLAVLVFVSRIQTIMWLMVDATKPDMQPMRDHSPQTMLFAWLLVAFFSLFILNLFVGVVMDTFSSQSEAVSTDAILTYEQRKWLEMRRMMLRVKVSTSWLLPDPAKMDSAFRRKCFALTYGKGANRFGHAINACIVINTLFMASRHFGQDRDYTTVLEVLELIFALIFTVEAVVKLIAVRMHYFHDGWNRFDLIVVVASDAGLILQYAGGVGNIGGVATIVRVFRLGRIFRLMRTQKKLNQLFNTLLLTLPHLTNISTLLMLLYFIYAVLGMQLFSTVRYGEHLNDHANFRSFPGALYTVVRASTGELWNGVMHDLASSHSSCEKNSQYDSAMCGYNDVAGCTPLNGCGSEAAAYFFFVTFEVLITFVFLNLFVCIIIDGWFSQEENDDDNTTDTIAVDEDATDGVDTDADSTRREFALTRNEYLEICTGWLEVDMELDHYITESELFRFLGALRRPIGLGLTKKDGEWPPPPEAFGRVSGTEVNMTWELRNSIRCEFGTIPTRKFHGAEMYQFEDVVMCLAQHILNKSSPELWARLQQAQQECTDDNTESKKVGGAFARASHKLHQKWEQRASKKARRFASKLTKSGVFLRTHGAAAVGKLSSAARHVLVHSGEHTPSGSFVRRAVATGSFVTRAVRARTGRSAAGTDRRASRQGEDIRVVEVDAQGDKLPQPSPRQDQLESTQGKQGADKRVVTEL